MSSKYLKINNRILISILIITIIFISGCSQGVYDTRKYIVGTDGLVMDFQKNNKEEVYEKEEFGIVMFVQNKGSTDITPENPAILRVNYDEYRLTLSSSSKKINGISNLMGKSQTAPIGEETPFESYFKTNLLTKNREGAKTEVTYNLCYPYKTEITTMTCIDTKKAVRDESAAACTSTPYSGGAGQGAPIVITKIEPETQLQSNYVRPQFKVYVSNFAKGYVTSASSCIGSESADITDANQVGYVNVEAWVSGTKLVCGTETNNGRLRIVDSNSYIKCYMPEGIAGYSRDQKNYLTPLTVRVSYTYTNIVEKKIEIIRDESISSSERNENDGLVYNDASVCNSYEIFDGQRCISRCEYCARNPSDPMCSLNKPFPEFQFKSNFECACDLNTCNDLTGQGKCIKGYCPGTTYCCAANTCASWQMWNENTRQCESKCSYCYNNPSAKGCEPMNSILSQNTTVRPSFSCSMLSKDQLEKIRADRDFIMLDSYCDEYNNLYCIADNYESNTLYNDYGGNAILVENVAIQDNSLCSFCAGNSGCSFENNGINGKITQDFGCNCLLEDKNTLESYNFVPDSKYCNNGKYCCNVPG
jgi:hypothetical protein